MTREPLPTIFVTVGTDHHPFDRLMRWIDGWLAAGGSERARCVVQSGTSVPPERAEWSAYLTYEEMQQAMRDAALVVSHGAGATTSMAAALNGTPIVVPRQKALGEHVDDHQVLFSRRIAKEGTIELAESEEELRRLLDSGLSGARTAFRGRRDDEQLAAVCRRVEQVVAGLFPTDPARVRPAA